MATLQQRHQHGDLMKALRLITPPCLERILLIMDSVALATLVATVVAVYEAVLAALVAREGGARDTLMADVRGVRRLLTEQPLDPAALLLKGRDWKQYAGESHAQRKDLELRLKQLLHPDLVAMREREDAKEAEQREQIKTQDEKRRRALVGLADTVERFGEQNVKGQLAAAGWNGQKIDRYFEAISRRDLLGHPTVLSQIINPMAATTYGASVRGRHDRLLARTKSPKAASSAA
jgi:hypothetical protein